MSSHSNNRLKEAKIITCTNDYVTCRNTGSFKFWDSIKKAVKIRAKRRDDLATLRQLAALPPEILKDVGVTHGDVNWAAKLPLELNATKELERVARLGACP